MASVQQTQQVKVMNRAILVALLLSVCALQSAKADIGDGLDSMYVVTGNEPSIYQSQRRLGLDAGYLRVRAPVSTFNVVNFSPPRFDVGCGGLDLYGGSFSFINAEEFRQMLRQIGANALGYAFKLALSSMCQDCEKNLTQLMNDIQEKMQMQVDSCKWAKGLVNSGAEALGFSVEQDYTLESAAEGTFADTFEAITSLFSQPGEDKSGGESDGADSTHDKKGNWTWNALRSAGTGAKFNFLAGNITHDELLMNIAGSIMVRAKKDSEVGEGDVVTPIEPRLRYLEFKTGKRSNGTSDNNAFPLMRCQDQAECIDRADVAQWSFEDGVEGWVAGKLQAAADHMADPATLGSTHDGATQNFLGSLPITTVRHMMLMQGDSAALNGYVRVIKDYVTKIYAGELAMQMTAAIRLAYDENDVLDLPLSINDTLVMFESEAQKDLRSASEGYFQIVKDTEEYVALHSRHYGDPGFAITTSNQ